MQAREACCAVVRCGTSRVVVFDGRDLPESPAREAELAQLMLGANHADGLGGDHYQLNKAAAVWPADEHAFRFRFYQVQRGSRGLATDLECANAASGAAVFALLRGLARLDGDGTIEALNEGTGQRILLRPHDAGSFWEGAWDVCFLLEEGGTPRRFSGSAPLQLATSDGGLVRFWVVEQGNVFVFAEVEREPTDALLIGHLEEAARTVALQLGSAPERASSPKVVAYSVRAVEEHAVHAAVACFYRGEMHASLPGSAAMCLASFLAGWRLDQLPPGSESGALGFYLHHRSGTLPVTVHWLRYQGEDRIVATEFTTPVRLLLRGAAVRPSLEASP